MDNPGSKFQIIHEIISKEGNILSVSDLCRVADVSRSGYYRWVNAAESRNSRELVDRSAFGLILAAYQFRGYNKGVRGIQMRLLHMGINMNPKKIRRLMHKYNLVCPIRAANPYRRIAKALHTNHVADNLVNREFRQHGPRSILLTDITFIPFNGNFSYLSVILDYYTRQVLSYVLSDSLEVDFVLETIHLLVKNHGVSLNTETIIHSDQGSHYTCHRFIRIVQDAGLRQSMSRRGNCWDNAPQESFFGHMKDELKNQIPKWKTFGDIKCSIDDWMDYYNNERYQWNLAKLSPNEYFNYLTTGEYPI
jgi:transposase InsO family protein